VRGKLPGIKRSASAIGRLPWLDRVRPYWGKEGGLRAVLVRGASGSFALRIASMSLNFLASLLIARLLGLAGYGAFAYAQSWVALLVVPAMLGLDLLLVRNIAAYRARFDWSLVKGLLRWANRAVLTTSVGLSLLAATAAWFFGKSLEQQMLSAFLVGLSLLPLAALIYIQQAAMRGLQRVVVGQLPEALIRPLLFLVLVGVAYAFLGENLGAAGAVGLSVVAAVVAFLIGARLLHRALPYAVTQAYPTYRGREWMRSVPPLLFLGGMLVIITQIPTILLGTMKGAEAAGAYAAVSRVALLITFIMNAANLALAPAIADLYASGDMARLRRMVMKSTRFILLFSLPLTLCLIVFNRQVLSIFGEGFTQGGAALSILSLGYLFSAAMGSVGILLIMTGYERDAATAIGASAVLNLVLNVALIPSYGLEGAAIATATSIVVQNLLLTVVSHRRLGMHASALGRIG
jgi:O-antigen/teichoic acid export membrane protein